MRGARRAGGRGRGRGVAQYRVGAGVRGVHPQCPPVPAASAGADGAGPSQGPSPGLGGRSPRALRTRHTLFRPSLSPAWVIFSSSLP